MAQVPPRYPPWFPHRGTVTRLSCAGGSTVTGYGYLVILQPLALVVTSAGAFLVAAAPA